MLNRSFRIVMVKDSDTSTDSPPIDYNEMATVITNKVITVVVVYIAADTVRRAAIYALSAKL